MRRNHAKRGFTLIEVLVASLLLGMLVTILTMVFNQSSIAWRTGKAGVSQLSTLRRQLSVAQTTADSLIPVAEGGRVRVGRVASPWDWEKGREIRRRALAMADNLNFQHELDGHVSDPIKTPGFGRINSLAQPRSGKQTTYVVGVLSYGPDGKRNTDDDITSWPEDIQ